MPFHVTGSLPITLIGEQNASTGSPNAEGILLTDLITLGPVLRLHIGSVHQHNGGYIPSQRASPSSGGQWRQCSPTQEGLQYLRSRFSFSGSAISTRFSSSGSVSGGQWRQCSPTQEGLQNLGSRFSFSGSSSGASSSSGGLQPWMQSGPSQSRGGEVQI